MELVIVFPPLLVLIPFRIFPLFPLLPFPFLPSFFSSFLSFFFSPGEIVRLALPFASQETGKLNLSCFMRFLSSLGTSKA